MTRRRTRFRSVLITLTAAAVWFGGVPPFVALVLGVAIAALLGSPSRAESTGRHLLACSVVALGCGLDLGDVVRVGCEGIASTAAMLALTFGIGWLLARRLGLRADVALLITAGTAICGGSAIAAIAPLIRARAVDVMAAVGVVFALNGIALVVFPLVGTWLALDAEAFGLWCALAIHDTSSVVGASATHSHAALEVATVTKLTRVLWIVPVGVWVVRARRTSDRDAAAVGPRLPWFLVAFLVAASIGAVAPAVRDVGRVVASQAPTAMSLALFAIGLGLNASLRSVLGGPALRFGFLLWMALAAVSLGYVGWVAA